MGCIKDKTGKYSMEREWRMASIHSHACCVDRKGVKREILALPQWQSSQFSLVSFSPLSFFSLIHSHPPLSFLPSCSDKCLFVFWTENCRVQCTCQKTADFFFFFFLHRCRVLAIRNLSLSERTPAVLEKKCNTQLTFAKANNVCNRLSCLYKRGCVLCVQNALLISVHFGGHTCGFVCKRESGMLSFSEASWAILMGVNGVDCGVGLAVGAVGFMPAGISSCHLLNRLPTNRGSLFGSTCHTVQSNPCQTERL